MSRQNSSVQVSACSIPHADLWSISRSLCGLNGDESQGSAALRPLLDALRAQPLGQRQVIWDAYLISRPDRAAILETLAEIDPEGPPPPRDADETAAGWGPIRMGRLPRAEPFPLDVLPGPARILVEAAVVSIGCAADYPAAATLAAASGAIGRSMILRVKAGYFTSASLYVALVGRSSCGKSPALRAALTPLWNRATALHEKWRVAKEAWDATPDDSKGPKPIMRRVVTTDPTTEALGPLLANNPRGLIVTPDETTKWIMSMDQYKGGRGGDRPFYLSAWGGEPVFIDRARQAQEPIAVPDPYLTVVGGITPGMLTELSEKSGRDDAFMARLLFVYPDRVTRCYSEEGIEIPVREDWRTLLRNLWRRPMRKIKDRRVPFVVTMTTEAAALWRSWCQAHYAEQEADDFSESLDGCWGKLSTYCARLALILHLMHWASSESQRQGADDPFQLPVGRIEDAMRLVTYFKSQAQRVYATLGGKADSGGDDVCALRRWIERNRKESFKEADIRHHLPRFRTDEAALIDALDWMTLRNLIRPRLEPESPRGPGRRSTPAWDVNPRLWDTLH